MDYFYTFLIVWAIWCAFNLLVALFAHRFAFVGNASVSGILAKRIVLSPKLDVILTPDEVEAIFQHEKGHIHHNHIMENLLVVCFIPFVMPFRYYRRQEQEHEADDYAAERVGAITMARAIMKLSDVEFDLDRAERLLRAHSVHSNGSAR